jgi:predicted Zn-ribbon and HTH transcriptional regulator
MKSKLMMHYCIDKTCNYKETNHKTFDGKRCPKCNGQIISEYPNKKINSTPPVKKFPKNG